MPLYTRRGDQGTSNLIWGERISKSDMIFEVLGTIDEVDAALGVARSQCRRAQNCEILVKVQKDLWMLMADIASLSGSAEQQRNEIGDAHVQWIEDQIQSLEENFPMPNGFIVPGDSYPAALLDVARTIARRAERRMVSYVQGHSFHNPAVMRYLNRLSSLCYALELSELSTGDD